MAKLESEKRPVIVRVQTEERARYVAEVCAMHGWRYIIGFEPDKPEDISDLERLLNPRKPADQKRSEGMSHVRVAVAKNTRSVAGRRSEYQFFPTAKTVGYRGYYSALQLSRDPQLKPKVNWLVIPSCRFCVPHG